MRRSELSEKSENLYTNSDFRTPIGGHPPIGNGGCVTLRFGQNRKKRFRIVFGVFGTDPIISKQKKLGYEQTGGMAYKTKRTLFPHDSL